MITAETINRLIKFQGDGLPVVSLYVAIDPGVNLREVHSRVISQLDEIDTMAKDHSLEHERRLSLRADLERIRTRVDGGVWHPKGIAIFACSGRGLYEEIPLPRRPRDRIVVDETAHVRPMLAVLDEYHRVCVVVIDKESARAWEIYQDEMRELTQIKDRVLRKPNFAAWRKEYNVRNKADELTKRHYRHVVQVLDELFRTDGYDLLIVGGHEFEAPAFLEFLPYDLRQRVAGTFSIDPTTEPIAEVRANADAITERYERDQDRRLLQETLDKFAAGGLATAGLESCLWAGSVAAIQQLLVEEGATTPGVVCDDSGWLALAGDTCPFCGKAARTTPDVIDDLVQAVIDEGGSIRHVETGETGLKEHTLAATLRFPLPQEPAPSAS